MWVKICGLTSLTDAIWAQECGADALGFVFEPSSVRFLRPDDRDWIHHESLTAEKFAVFGICTEDVGLDVHQAVQFEAPIPVEQRMPCLRVHADGKVEDILCAWEKSGKPGRLVLDTYSPTQYGGTGHSISLDLAAEFVRQCPAKVILAGGLSPESVAEAVRIVRPAGVDVSSGVEAELRHKDHGLVKAFIEAARSV